MKVSELSRRSGVPLPTIKFYIREGLLPPGVRTGRNQAEYSEEHLERLALVRALKDDAGLPVATIGRALVAADRSTSFVDAVIRAIDRPGGSTVDSKSLEFAEARTIVLELAEKSGWVVEADLAAVEDAACALVVIRRSFPETADILTPYADIATQIARHEIPDDWRPAEAPNAALRYAVLGTLLFEPFILALRRMAHVARATEILRRKTKRPNTKRPKWRPPVK